MPEDKNNSLVLTVPPGPLKRRTTKAKHGIYSWVDSKRLPQGRAFEKTRRELATLRTTMIEQRGGDEKITPEELILIDSVVEALGVQKLLGIYTKKYGIIDGQSVKRERLELSPILGKNWVGYANVVRQAVLALEQLKASRGHNPEGPDLNAIQAEYEVQPAEDAPVCPIEA